MNLDFQCEMHAKVGGIHGGKKQSLKSAEDKIVLSTGLFREFLIGV